jgi:hypothetical protein
LLDGHELIDLHCAELADATQIVALKIDQHQVFCPFLFIREEVSNETSIVSLVSPARSRSGNWAGIGQSTLKADQSLGRATHQSDVIKVQESRKRGRIDATEAAV